jgi:magnesium chelatase subunit D
MTFTDIVGLDLVKQALLLLAVDPGLRGCAMSASIGAGKSMLARTFAALLPVHAPFVAVPLNTTEDRLIGGLDLEATLASGARVVERGLLSQAHGGVLYVDGLNLLDNALCAALVDALSSGVVRVERDGVSAAHPAEFALLATFDSADGALRAGILDRIGLIAPFTAVDNATGRAEVVRRNVYAQATDDDDALAMLRAMIVDARARVGSVGIDDRHIAALAQLAESLGVEGNRAEVFAVRAAVASAALAGRSVVDEDDLKIAARFVLMPRATRLPEQAAEQAQPQSARSEPAPAPQDAPDDAERPRADDAPAEALMLSALTADVPADVLSVSFAAQRRGRSGSRGQALNARRGRFVRAVPAPPRAGRISVLHTLLAAAPWQRLRAHAGRAGGGPQLTASDLRTKRYRDKAGTLFVFIVDASGSMAINRMREAKGAAAALLQNAYVHRDQVALISCRGRQAQVLLPPSTSVDRAKRELDVLPTGGATPLAHALLCGWQLARQARGRGVGQVALVLLSDGRGNVGLNGDACAKSALQDEIARLAALIRGDGLRAIVIDTQANHLSRGEGPALARALDGRYVYLPNASAAQIAATAGEGR